MTCWQLIFQARYIHHLLWAQRFLARLRANQSQRFVQNIYKCRISVILCQINWYVPSHHTDKSEFKMCFLSTFDPTQNQQEEYFISLNFFTWFGIYQLTTVRKKCNSVYTTVPANLCERHIHGWQSRKQVYLNNFHIFPHNVHKDLDVRAKFFPQKYVKSQLPTPCPSATFLED